MNNYIKYHKQDIVNMKKDMSCKYNTIIIDKEDVNSICNDLQQEEALLSFLRQCFQYRIEITIYNLVGIDNLTKINQEVSDNPDYYYLNYITVFINIHNSLFKVIVNNKLRLQLDLDFINQPFEELRYFNYNLTTLFGDQFYYVQHFQELFDDINVLKKLQKL